MDSDMELSFKSLLSLNVLYQFLCVWSLRLNYVIASVVSVNFIFIYGFEYFKIQ